MILTSSSKRHLKTAVFLVFVVCFFNTLRTTAQVFPVQASINVAPPYSVYLSQYTSSDQEKVFVNVLLRDPVITSVDVKFRFTIEGDRIKLTTNPAWNPQPFNLTGGIASILPQELIAEYFKPQNLIVEGVNPQEFFRSGKLPEGIYQFKVEVIEYRRGITISNIGHAVIWLQQMEAPTIFSPQNNEKVLANFAQSIVFRWSNTGASSPYTALTTQYEFTLVEMVDPNVDPTVALISASNATKYVKLLDQTSFYYGVGDMMLTPGKKYAFRVKAFTTDRLEMFKNGGYSEVRTFTFGDACNKPISFTLSNPKQSTFDIEVYTDPSNTAWQAHFRESANSEEKWSELKSEPGTNIKTVRGLKPITEYEVQIIGLCGMIPSNYTESKTITTGAMADPNRSCNGNPTPFVVNNAPSLSQLNKGDLFLAALFPIKVMAVKSQSGGKFSGRGIATLPLFNTGLDVTFDNIGINNLMQLTSGEVKVVRDELNINLFGETPNTNGNGTGDTNGGGDTTNYPPITDTLTIPTVYDSLVIVNDSTVIVYQPNGAPVTVNLGGSTCTLLIPADGNMNNAQIVYDGAAHPYHPGQGGNNTGDPKNFTGLFARFKAHQVQTHGFDTLNYNVLANYYKQLTIAGNQYYLPWKALKDGTPEPVKLFIKQGTDSMAFTNLKVKQTGVGDLTPSAGAGTQVQTYMLSGSYKGVEESVVAYYTADDKENYAGGLYTTTYGESKFKLILVPLPDITIDNMKIGGLQQEINQIYSQAVVSWSVSQLTGFTGVDLGENGLDWADKNMLSSYNSEMNSLISAFKSWKSDADPDAYYLFIVPKFSEGNVEGFMPRNRRFGFVTQSQLIGTTIAHELGHGAFNLKHTFSASDWSISQGTTDNLMDYAQGIKLWKPQWDFIHDPEATTGLFDGMEDGAMELEPDMPADSIKYLIDKIHKANIDMVGYLDITNFALSQGVVKELNIEQLKMDYLGIQIFGKLKPKESGDNNQTNVVEKLYISPSDSLIEKSNGPKGEKGNFVKFIFNQYNKENDKYNKDDSYAIVIKTRGKYTQMLKEYLKGNPVPNIQFPCEECGRELFLTYKNLLDIFPSSSILENHPEIVTHFNDAINNGKLNTCRRLAHLLSQCDAESNGLNATNEWTNYYLDRMLNIFESNQGPKEKWFKQSFWDSKDYLNYVNLDVYELTDTAKKVYGDFDAITYNTYKWKDPLTGILSQTNTVRAPLKNDKINGYLSNIGKGAYKMVSVDDNRKLENGKRVLNVAYKNVNGNTQDEDGYLFRGRGIIQLTGRETYTEVQKVCNTILKANFIWGEKEETLNNVKTNPKDMIYSAIGFLIWKFNDLTKLDTDDSYSVTLMVNAKRLDKDIRKAKFELLKKDFFKNCNPNKK